MKLRNKKTGDIWEFDSISMKILDTTMEKLKARGWSGSCFANSIAELNEEWEDAEGINVPIIKDEKIRKAVRAWADANGIDRCVCKDEMHCITFETERGMFISFENADPIPPEGNFAITQLCGDEKE